MLLYEGLEIRIILTVHNPSLIIPNAYKIFPKYMQDII